MTRRKLKGIILVLWPFLFLACASIEVRTQATKSNSPGVFSQTEILAVQTHSGEYYRFFEGKPARVAGDQVVGEAIAPKEFPLGQIVKQKRNARGEVVEFTEANGKVHKSVFALTQDQKFLAYLPDAPLRPISLAYGDIGVITTRKRAGGPGTLMLILGLIVVGAAVLMIAGWHAFSEALDRLRNTGTGESYPFVYSH